jgi:transposase
MEARGPVGGIDVSKDRLDVHVRPTGETFAVGRDPAGLETLCRRLVEIGPAAITLEATGGFETIMVAALTGASLPAVMLNPAQIRSSALTLGRRAKTDPIDAAVIAHFVAAAEVEVRPLPGQAARRLGGLVARRRQVLAMIGAECDRGRRITDPGLKGSVARIVGRGSASSPCSTRRSTPPCAARRLGARPRTSSPRCRAWGRRSRGP